MIMGHSADASNRLKSNKSLRTKVNPYEVFKDYSKPPPSNKRYNFKTPTVEQLKKMEARNRAFLKEQKKEKLVFLIFGFLVGLAILYWFSQTEIWAGYIEGFGRYAR